MSDSPISKKDLEYLAGLARMRLTEKEEARFTGELGNILEHVSALGKVKTEGVAPMNGGTQLKDVFREDASRENTNRGEGVEQFPEKETGYLKVPPIFGQ